MPPMCDYPMCPAAKDASMELERHNELREDLQEIKKNQGEMVNKLMSVVIKLEQIATLFAEQTRIKEDINNLGNKIRTIEDEKIERLRVAIGDLGKQRLGWAQSIILLLISGPMFGILGALLAKFWNKIF